MTVKNLSSITPPNLANKALIADVQAFEPYGSKAFNRQLMGVIQKGVYSGFTLSPAASGLSVVVSSAGKSAAAVELGQEWLINVRQKANVTLAVPAGRLSTIVLTAFYDGSTLTDQVDADSTVKAAQLLVVNAGAEPADCVILGQVNVPSNATSITAPMFTLDKRDRVSLEGFWNKLDEENIAPKGQWLRTILNKGIKPSLDNVRAAAVDTIGATNAWFKESWVNSYRGGSIDVEGTIKSDGRLAVLRGDFGIGGVSSLLPANTNLNSLPAENGKYRGVSLLNTPDGATVSGSWWFVDHSAHNAQYQYQQAMKFDGSLLGVWFRACVNSTWTAWDRAYSVQNKPTKTDVGLSAVANERQYSAQNNNIGAGATNYAAGDHKHDADYSKLGHTHPWSQLTEIPIQATRWPTAVEAGAAPTVHTHAWAQVTGAPVFTTRWPTIAEIGAQAAGSYAPASHTHDWENITGAPVFTTRWPTAVEAGAAPTAHTHDWANITGEPVYTTRWPTVTEVGAAAASHTHAWAQVTGAPVYTTRWPTVAEVGAAAASHTHPWSQVTGVPVQATRWPAWAEVTGKPDTVEYVRALTASDNLNNITDTGWYDNQANANATPANSYPIANAGKLEVHSSGNMVYQSYHTYTDPKLYIRTKNTTTWSPWSEVYSSNNKPTLAELGAAAASHTHAWAQVTGAPVYTTRWPTAVEAGAAPTAHTHAWAQVTGAPVYTTRWPTAVEAGAAPTAHTHDWENITGEPVYTTRWPTVAEVGAAAASHTHAWAQVTGAPVYTTRWPTVAEIGAAAASHTHAWAQVTGVPVQATRWPTLAEIGAAGTDGSYGIYTDFTVAGDANTYYPVLISKGQHAYGYDEFNISRGYSWAAPITWNNSTHKGGLTLAVRWTGDGGWGGNDKALRVEHFAETYSTMVGGMELTTGGLLVYLRGGGALYRLQTVNGERATATPLLTPWTATSGSVHSSISYSAARVNSEVRNIMPIISGSVYDNGSRVYSENNNPTPAAIGAAPTVHTHPWAQVIGAPVYTTRWPTAVEAGAAPTVHTHAWAQVTGAPVFTTRWPTAVEAGAAPTSHTHAWAQVTGAPVFTTRWPTIAEIGAQAAGSYAAAAHTHDQHEVTVLGNKLNVSSDGMISNGDTANRHAGMYGIYDAAKTHNIWSMGTAYKVAADGSTFGNLYGFAYKHTNNPTGGTMAGSHQAVWCQNGVPMSAIGDGGLWTAGTVYEAGAALATRYAGISHTHPWSQITGIPVQATRWPNASEVGLAGLSSSTYNSLLISTSYGTLNLGAKNASHQHYETSMPNHWFNKEIKVQGEIYAGAAYDQRVYHEGNKPTPAAIGAVPAVGSAWSGTDAVNQTVGLLAWRNYSNHVIFDASSGLSPQGQAIDRNDSVNAWASSFPTLMGWNGVATYGVRVDSARIADRVVWSGISGVPVQATRWPNSTEVGLGKVPNVPFAEAAAAGHVPIRDDSADVHARLFRSNYQNQSDITGAMAFRNNTTDNYIRFCSNPAAIRDWLGAAPSSAYTTRWPTWEEVSGKPATVNKYKLIYNSGNTPVFWYTLPAECTVLLAAGKDLEFLVYAWQDTAKTYGGSATIRFLGADWNRSTRQVEEVFDVTFIYVHSGAYVGPTERGKMSIQNTKPVMIYYKEI
jgi:hypothetical protein